ncbi:MAG TPA: SWIM zinc finger family protein [Intrasporangium sp.]|uniref:SWIM zinc finger family protein n=1 Tax=Intrasporangium sp. TaxID=1925024 RepID=UPI002D765DE3|nr:SWIM zinc finger family protein [Intrasporangium sp.]HET7398142.1 SWIM zinc finger family protein [Intrasporangium sp.]
MTRFYPPSTPRAVEGGIVARSKRGAIAQHWWSKRFITVLEGMGLGSRLQRGRTYARKGQVVSLEIEAGSVAAQVQGSRARPYRVRIGASAFGKAEWAQIERQLAGNAWYLANLLAGEMPDDIEDVFTGIGLSLFPTSASDLSLDCSCPDWEVPCKHLAATFYLLAESFDEDPFRILAWRGRHRDDLLGNLHAARTDSPRGTDDPLAAGPPLESLLGSFFAPQGPVHRSRSSAQSRASLLDQLPPVEVAVRGRTLPDLLRPAYESRAAPGEA